MDAKITWFIDHAPYWLIAIGGFCSAVIGAIMFLLAWAVAYEVLRWLSINISNF